MPRSARGVGVPPALCWGPAIRHRRRRSAGQSLVEFSMVVGVFLILVFAGVSAALHAVQRGMAETAAAAGVQVAASATANDPTGTDLQGAMAPTQRLLSAVMFATNIQSEPGVDCSGTSPAGVPNGTLEVCTYVPAPGMVAETIVGRPAYLVPFLAGLLGWTIDVTLEMHQVGYQP